MQPQSLLPNPLAPTVTQTYHEKPIALSPEARSAISSLIERYDMAADAEKGSMANWWREVEAAYRNEKPQATTEGITPVPYPFLQPRVDGLTAQVCTVITKQSPIMLSTGSGSNEVFTRKQTFMHEVLSRARIDIQARKAAIIAGNLNKAIYRVVPKLDMAGEDAYGGQQAASRSQSPGVSIDVIHPKDFFMYPAGLGGIEEAIWVAHRFYQRVSDVKTKIEAGDYYPVDSPTGGDSVADYDETGAIARSGANLQAAFSSEDSDLAECRYGWLRIDLGEWNNRLKGERWYRAVWLAKTRTLLALRPTVTTSPEYFDTWFIPEWSQFWPSNSVGRNLLGLHNYQGVLASTLYTGGMMSALPPVFGPALGVKDQKYNFGDYFATDDMTGQGSPWSPTISFNGQPIVMQMQNNERIGDMVARVSQNALGAAVQDSTATQQSIIAAGVAVGIEEYIANFSSCLPRMAEYINELLVYYYNELAPHYLDTNGQPLASKEELGVNCTWVTNGTSPQSTPGARIRDAQMLLQNYLALGPASGLDPYEITACIKVNSSLSGITNVQMTKESALAQQQQMALAAAANANTGDGASAGPPASPGPMAGVPDMGEMV